MAKHTPGPWTVDALGVQARWNIDTLEGTSVAITNQLPGDKNWQERDANTALIAAAPEMLECMQKLLAEYQNWRVKANIPEDHTNSLMEKCRIVVGKATGAEYE